MNGFILAITAGRDANAQSFAQTINQEHTRTKALTLLFPLGPDHKAKLVGLFEIDGLKSPMKEGCCLIYPIVSAETKLPSLRACSIINWWVVAVR